MQFALNEAGFYVPVVLRARFTHAECTDTTLVKTLGYLPKGAIIIAAKFLKVVAATGTGALTLGKKKGESGALVADHIAADAIIDSDALGFTQRVAGHMIVAESPWAAADKECWGIVGTYTKANNTAFTCDVEVWALLPQEASPAL